MTKIYALFLLMTACLCYSSMALSTQRARRAQDHAGWMICAGAFVGFGVIRWFQLEEQIRQVMRTALIEMGKYQDRRILQAIIVAMILLGFVIFFYLMTKRYFGKRKADMPATARPSIWTITAQIACFSLFPLFLLRIVSLHWTDQLIYGGPVPLNRVIDVLLSTTVALCAAIYTGQNIRARRYTRALSRRQAPSDKHR